MKARTLFAIFAAGISMLLAQVPPAHRSRIGPADIYPDPVRTPGAANPQVTQENIKDNICNRHWSTKLIRPPAEYTSKLKRKQLREYGDTMHQTRAELVNPSTGKVDTTRCVAHSDNMACYEEDHLISLEDGGNPTDPRNLWPEAYNTRVGGTIMGAHQKDVVEGFIHDEICYDIPNLRVERCDEGNRVLFGRLDNQPVVFVNELRLGQQIAVSFANIREHRKPQDF